MIYLVPFIFLVTISLISSSFLLVTSLMLPIPDGAPRGIFPEGEIESRAAIQ